MTIINLLIILVIGVALTTLAGIGMNWIDRTLLSENDVKDYEIEEINTGI